MEIRITIRTIIAGDYELIASLENMKKICIVYVCLKNKTKLCNYTVKLLSSARSSASESSFSFCKNKGTNRYCKYTTYTTKLVRISIKKCAHPHEMKHHKHNVRIYTHLLGLQGLTRRLFRADLLNRLQLLADVLGALLSAFLAIVNNRHSGDRSSNSRCRRSNLE